MADNSSVKVAIRIRPLVSNEISKGCRDIVDVIEENDQVVIKSLDREDKAFTFNYVLATGASQSELYNRSVQPLIPNLFKVSTYTNFNSLINTEIQSSVLFSKFAYRTLV